MGASLEVGEVGMYFKIWIVLFSFILTMAPSHVWAKPIEARSENFVIYGNLSNGSAESLLKELEDYRAAILTKMGANDIGPELIPVKIYTASGSEDIAKLTGSKGAGGVYLTSVEGPVFVLNSRAGFTRGKRARRIALHEYTHHLLAGFSSVTYPRWFNEGLAEYLSTFEIDSKDQMRIGGLNQYHAQVFQNIKWMPYKTVLGSVRNYPFRNDDSRNTQLIKSVFYAQSWLAVHFIQSHPEYSPKFVRYIELLNQIETPPNAFEEAFDMSVDDFEKLMRAYYKKNRFMTARIAMDSRKEVEIKTREMSKAELALHHADATRHFRVSKAGYKVAEKFYQKAAKDPSLLSRINISRAHYLSNLKRHDEALALILPESERRVDDSYVQRLAGMIILNKNDTGDVPDPVEIQKARALLKTSLQLDNDNIPAHYYYAQTYIVSRDIPTAQAVGSAITGLHYYRSDNFVDKNVDLAEVLIRADKSSDAVPTLKRAMAWSRSGDVRYYAYNQLLRIQNEGVK